MKMRPSKRNEGIATSTTALAVATFLAQRFLQADSSVQLHHRRILVLTANTGSSDLVVWKDSLYNKQMSGIDVLTEQQLDAVADKDALFFDSVLWLFSRDAQERENATKILENIRWILVSAGLLIYCTKSPEEAALAVDFCDMESLGVVATEHDGTIWKAAQRWPCRIAAETCSWLSRKHSVVHERGLLSAATVSLSVHEQTTGSMSTHSIRRAVVAMQKHGYCIVSGLLYTERQRCLDFGAAVLSDLHSAAAMLLRQEGIDLYNPAASTKDPATYRELSMREDFRMDIRHGPALHKIRGCVGGNAPITITAVDSALKDDFLRGNANVLSIVRRVMNPIISKELSAGNFGRYNFEGSGPDGSYQDVKSGIVGGIVSLPGSADQAIHADTPHLFENAPDPLPAHYINVFTPGCPAVDNVGQTAFVHGSHRLDFVAKYCTGGDNDSLEQFAPAIWGYLVRPRVDVGDVLLFDCRILHFGLANTHRTAERPLLYANMTMHWFHDPKNWDQHRRIFPEEAYADNAADTTFRG